MESSRSLHRDLLAVGILAALFYLLAALVSYDPADPVAELIAPLDQIYQPDIHAYPQNEKPTNACGRFGALVADLLFATFGVAAYYVLLGLGVLAIAMLVRGQLNSIWIRTLGWVMSLIGISALLHRGLNHIFPEVLIGPGGYLGALGAGLLNANFGPTGSLILMGTLTLVGVMFWTDYFVFRMLRWGLAPLFVGVRAARIHRGVWGGRGSKDAAAGEAIGKWGAKSTDGSQIPVRSATARDDLTIPAKSPIAAKTSIDPPMESRLLASSVIGDEELDDEDDSAIDSAPDEGDDEFETEQVASRLASANKGKLARNGGAKSAKPSDPRQQVIQALNQVSAGDQPASFELPRVELLDLPSEVNFEEQREDALRKARILEKTFHQFGFNVKVVDIETGPVIAQYELELEAGLRLAKITNLSDDLAIALRVPAVRIVAPIPGKNTVGIEVPNERRQVVRLRGVMERGAPKAEKMKIPLFIGQDVRGEPLVVDLATLPHLLIAGRTGTGKSVCLNAIIASILMTRRPDEVRMLMIDPKMVELSGYGRLPHLMHPVVTDMRKAEAILAWAVDKMEERYALLARAGVRHITSYNQLGEQELIRRLQPETDDERSGIPLSLPFIVIVADEMADLMMTSGKEVQQHIIRLAQKSRAVGIHLILATQKPTVDVITGLIKSNLPARIAFQVATRTDSQVVLDCNGSEKLLGNGDLLFLWPGTSTLLRGQGTYLTDEEIVAVTNAASTGEQNFVHELVNMRVADPNQAEGGEGLKHRDEVYAQAVEVVIREGRGSVSLLQRALGIGYGRAARLIDFMEQDGVVGVYAGSKSREVIMSLGQWHDLQSSSSSDGNEATNSPRQIVSPLVAKLTSRPPNPRESFEDDDDEVEPLDRTTADADWSDEESSEDDEHWNDEASEEADSDDGDSGDEETADEEAAAEGQDTDDDEDDADDEADGESDGADDESDDDEDARLPIRLARPPHRNVLRSKRTSDE